MGIFFFCSAALQMGEAPHRLHCPHAKRNERTSPLRPLRCRTPLTHTTIFRPISPPINLPSVPHPSPTFQPLHSSPTPCSASRIHPSFSHFQSMLAPPVEPSPNTDPLVLYSQSLRDYTLRLWMESRKQAEERVRARAHKKHQAKASMPASTRKASSDGESSSSDSSNDGSTTMSSQGLPA